MKNDIPLIDHHTTIKIIRTAAQYKSQSLTFYPLDYSTSTLCNASDNITDLSDIHVQGAHTPTLKYLVLVS